VLAAAAAAAVALPLQGGRSDQRCGRPLACAHWGGGRQWVAKGAGATGTSAHTGPMASQGRENSRAARHGRG